MNQLLKTTKEAHTAQTKPTQMKKPTLAQMKTSTHLKNKNNSLIAELNSKKQTLTIQMIKRTRRVIQMRDQMMTMNLQVKTQRRGIKHFMGKITLFCLILIKQDSSSLCL